MLDIEEVGIFRGIGIGSVAVAITVLRMNWIYHWLDKTGVLAVGEAAVLICVAMFVIQYKRGENGYDL